MRTTLLTYAKGLLVGLALLQMQPAFSQTTSLPHKKHSSLGETVIQKFGPKATAPATADNTFQYDPSRKCLTMEADASLRKRHASIGTLDDFEQDLQKNIKDYKERLRTSRTQAAIYTIPVIVHVIHNGEPVGTGSNITAAQIQSQIDVLNEDFRRKSGTPGFNNNPAGADIEIEFALALRGPDGSTLPEPGINRVNMGKASWDSSEDIDKKLKPKSIWDTDKYLNLWTVNFGGESKSLLGYAQFPIKSGLQGLDITGYPTGANTDGVVLNYKAVGRVGTVGNGLTGRTATHEIGHWLGLRHIWGDDNGGCSKDDFCADTPKTADKHYGCSKGEDTCTDPGKDMVENYMDYSDDECVNIFTNDQKTRMRTVLEKCPRRKELLTSTVHIPVGGSNKPIADFTVNQTIACDGATIQFTDKSSANTTAWKWEFFNGAGQSLATFTNQNQSVTFTGAGTYGVRLIASNAAGRDTISFTNYITILSNTNLAFPFAETTEGNTNNSFPNWVAYNPDGDRGWTFAEGTSGFGTGSRSVYFDNYSGNENDNPYGTIDGILSNKINLAANQFTELTFDVAYARYSAELTDTLLLYYSTDCGQTFRPFWKKGGKDLATAPDAENNFVPTASQWRKESISLGFLNGQTSVYLAIVNSSGWGNNVYLDNIKVQVPAPTQKPEAAFTVASQTVCVGAAVQFSDVSQQSPREWNWTFPGGTPATSTKQHPSVTYHTPGTYAVTLTAKNALGTGTITQQAYITVTAKPVLQITASKTSICPDEEVELTASGAATYNWYEGTTLIGSGARITVKPMKDAVFQVVGVNSTGCEGSATRQISVNSTITKPTIIISAPADSAAVTLTCQTTADTYQWFKDGAAIASATSKTYSVRAAGSYTVRVTSGQCSLISTAVVLTSSPEESIARQEYRLYPNPVSDGLTIELPGIKQAIKVTIYNTLGMKLAEKEVSPGQTNGMVKLPVAQYPNGHYFVQITGEGIHYTQSFIKQ
jgi:PKD repeat protein